MFTGISLDPYEFGIGSVVEVTTDAFPLPLVVGPLLEMSADGVKVQLFWDGDRFVEEEAYVEVTIPQKHLRSLQPAPYPTIITMLEAWASCEHFHEYRDLFGIDGDDDE